MYNRWFDLHLLLRVKRHTKYDSKIDSLLLKSTLAFPLTQLLDGQPKEH